MNLDDMLAAAAASVGSAQRAELTAGRQRLETEYRRRQRDDIARARHAALIDSLELEQAAYELGRRHDKEGNLGDAARWYRVAARSDHGDAALRLAEVLDLLADRCVRDGGPETGDLRREELRLIGEAAQAYTEAYAAGYLEAADKLDDMLAAFSRRQSATATVDDPAPQRVAERDDRCSYVQDFTPEHDVLTEEEIHLLSQHVAQCVPCLMDFVAQAADAAAAVPTGNVTNPYKKDGEVRQPTGTDRLISRLVFT